MTKPVPRRLVVVSAAIHHRHEGRIWSHAPYVRELDLWGDLFPRLVVVAPVVDGPPPGDAAPLERANVSLVGVPPTGGETVAAKLRQLVLLPALVGRLLRVLLTADAVHVRCPGNLGLLGAVLAPVCSRNLVAKYAGQWTGFPGEVWTVRLQRRILGSRWWRGPVTVYGDWPAQPPKVRPFFTSVLSEAQIARARALHRPPRQAGRLRVLFVGRLSAPKNVGSVLRAAAAVRRDGVDVTVTVAGDGGERQNLDEIAYREGIADRVRFLGAVGLERVLDEYVEADTLVLISESEGWPKAIAEGMTFGLTCIGSDRGLVPQMLGDGRGLVCSPGDADALADHLRWLAAHPAEADEMAARATRWGRQYSLEGLRSALTELLRDAWQVDLAGPDERTAVLHVTDTLEAGGAERVAVNLVNTLDRDHYRPLLCTTRREGLLSADVASDVGRLRLDRSWRVSDPRAILQLARFVRRQPVDILHAHGTSLFIASAARLLVPGTRLVWHDHLGAGTESRRRARLAYRLAVGRADRVIAVNEDLASWDRRELGVPGARLHRIPNFVVAPPPRAAGSGPPPLPGRAETRIVSVANLRPHKDHLGFVRAMAEVVRAEPDAHALLLGAEIVPAVGEAVRQAIADLGLGDHVSLLGSRSEVDAVLAECAVGVLSSRSEGFPLALLEYGFAGLPVVSTDVGQCAEILDHGRAGVLVPPHDPAALAAAVVGLLRDPDRARELGKALHERVSHTYEQKAVVAEVEAIYDELRPGAP